MKMIKKFTAVLMAALLVGSAMVFSTVTAAGNDFTVDISTNVKKAAPGDTVVFNITVNNIGGDGLIGIDLPVSFDKNAFEFVGSTASFPSEWESPIDLSWSAAKDGLVVLRALDDGDNPFDNGCKTNGSISFTVSFRVKEVDTYDLAHSISVADSGSYKLCGAFSDATMALGSGDSVAVTVVGAVVIVRGDVNMDGKVSPLDASLVLQADAMLIDLTEAQVSAGDVNYDGNISPLDASLILQYNAGLITWEALDAIINK